MREFVLLFRMDIVNDEAQPKPAQMAVYLEQWATWIKAMTASGCVVQGGNHLCRQGVVLSGSSAQTGGAAQAAGPYVGNDVSVAGYLVVQAADEEHALRFARQCPILRGDRTSVELREAESLQ